ncbi:ATP-grasp domain-containing protein [Tessaracoccus palaemonis]|uniref:ATP-grasp domain-containing protein n=1 Tax=Tessaracoccus palaemonis TaxID=2829499 RepID=A0ABX8SLR2_9ACTN|nr:hypothetical protein [Tessaracoccus palaemonis]QXT63580.1 hypothetical protein KDB89_03645 [Tessaracoccus palaemonis]
MSVQVATAEPYLGVNPDDNLLLASLHRAGADATLAAWDDPAQAWDCDAVILRSTWGYQSRIPDFLGWLDRLDEAGCAVLNPTQMVRDNIDKAVQFEWLDRLGIQRIPEFRIDRRAPADRLVGQLRDHFPDAEAYVVKPSISASGHHTLLFDPDRNTNLPSATLEEVVALVDDVIARDWDPVVILQPYAREIEQGETAVVFIGGAYSHAFTRFPGVIAGGRGAEVTQAAPEQVALADRVLAGLPTMPAYARVDLISTAHGPVVMEVELAEPWLGFSLLPDAARERAVDSLAGAVVAASVRA